MERPRDIKITCLGLKTQENCCVFWLVASVYQFSLKDIRKENHSNISKYRKNTYQFHRFQLNFTSGSNREIEISFCPFLINSKIANLLLNNSRLWHLTGVEHCKSAWKITCLELVSSHRYLLGPWKIEIFFSQFVKLATNKYGAVTAT